MKYIYTAEICLLKFPVPGIINHYFTIVHPVPPTTLVIVKDLIIIITDLIIRTDLIIMPKFTVLTNFINPINFIILTNFIIVITNFMVLIAFIPASITITLDLFIIDLMVVIFQIIFPCLFSAFLVNSIRCISRSWRFLDYISVVNIFSSPHLFNFITLSFIIKINKKAPASWNRFVPFSLLLNAQSQRHIRIR